MNKTLTSMLVLGTSAVLLVPTTGTAWAHRGDDDSSHSSDDRSGRDRDRSSDDSSTPGDDDGTPDQGSDDNGRDDSSDDDSSDDNGRDDSSDDNGRDDSSDDNGRDDSSRGRDGRVDDSRGRDRDRRDKDRIEVRRSGECSVASQWRIRIKLRDDRARIKFQVDSNVIGEQWAYSVSDNGTEVLSGSRWTHAPSGDFTVQRKWRGGSSGGHSVTATATNPQTGETCEGAATA